MCSNPPEVTPFYGIDDLEEFKRIQVTEEWKRRLAEELIEMKNGIMDVEILTSDKINEILSYVHRY